MVLPFMIEGKKQFFSLGQRGKTMSVVSHVVRFSQEMYVMHLQDKIGYFAQGSQVWEEAFDEYWEGLNQRLSEWKETYEGNELELTVVEGLTDWLAEVLEKGPFAGWDEKVPLLCPCFLQDLLDLFTEIQPALSLVSARTTIL